MFEEKIKRMGLKVTLARIKILALFERSESEHLSADEIYQKLSQSGYEIGLATVYRVLTQFESVGLIKRHHFEGNLAVYELEKGEHHDHLVCVRCESVKEFFDSLIEARQVKIAQELGFKVMDHVLTLYGLCINCQKS